MVEGVTLVFRNDLRHKFYHQQEPRGATLRTKQRLVEQGDTYRSLSIQFLYLNNGLQSVQKDSEEEN